MRVSHFTGLLLAACALLALGSGSCGALDKDLDLRPAHARDAFRAAAERDPENPRPHFYLAVIHGDKLGRSKDALAALERYAELGGKEPSALSWLAELRAQLGRK